MNNIQPLQIEAFRVIQEQFPNSEAIFNKAVEIMILKAGRCVCDVPINTFYIRIPDQYKYRCKRCRIIISPLSITPFKKQHTCLTNTLDLACRFFQARGVIPPSKISQIYKCRFETAETTTKRVVQWMKLALGQSQYGFQMKSSADNKVVRIFSKNHETLTAAVDSLFSSLPSMKLAMNNSKINNHNNKSHANCHNKNKQKSWEIQRSFSLPDTFK